jgi:hypothetical protein
LNCVSQEQLKGKVFHVIRAVWCPLINRSGNKVLFARELFPRKLTEKRHTALNDALGLGSPLHNGRVHRNGSDGLSIAVMNTGLICVQTYCAKANKATSSLHRDHYNYERQWSKQRELHSYAQKRHPQHSQTHKASAFNNNFRRRTRIYIVRARRQRNKIMALNLQPCFARR